MATGRCLVCKKGFYLDFQSGSCKECRNGCEECTSYDFCTKCNPMVHNLVRPSNGYCQCDAYRGWYKASEDDPWSCNCTKEFLTDDGQCLDCKDAFNDCSSCEKIDKKLNGSIKVVDNPLNYNSKSAGTYACIRCYHNGSMGDVIYNHDSHVCERCD